MDYGLCQYMISLRLHIIPSFFSVPSNNAIYKIMMARNVNIFMASSITSQHNFSDHLHFFTFTIRTHFLLNVNTFTWTNLIIKMYITYMAKRRSNKCPSHKIIIELIGIGRCCICNTYVLKMWLLMSIDHNIGRKRFGLHEIEWLGSDALLT